MRFDTLSVAADGSMTENVLVGAARYALENTAAALWAMMIPPLLKPAAYALLRRFPTPQLATLNLVRTQLFTAGIVLAKNAMRRLGIAWTDDLGMEAEFGELRRCCWGGGCLCVGAASK